MTPRVAANELSGAKVALALSSGPDASVMVGTGVDVGVIVAGQLAYGLTRPQAGRFFPRRDLIHGSIFGACPVHRDRLDGIPGAT